MPLKYYIPISLLFFVAVLTLVHHYGVPVLPFALIMFFAETALGLMASDHKAGDKVAEYLDALKPHHRDGAHRVH